MTRKKSASPPNAGDGPPETAEGIADRMRRCLQAAFSGGGAMADAPPLPMDIVRACEALVTEGAETCRLVALTVVSAAAADPDVPPHKIQAGAGGKDFRSLYKESVRPILVAAAVRVSAPWQPSRDPFVSNPYREPTIDAAWLERRKNKLAGADALLTLVSHVAANPASASAVLHDLARFELGLLEKSAVVYRIPPRLSTSVVTDVLEQWLANDTGGRRYEGVSVALLRFAGTHLRAGWDTVESHHVNDPKPYDALCKADGIVRAVGEVKAQEIDVDQLRQLSAQMDHHQARRAYLFTRISWLPATASPGALAISDFLRGQYALGRRIDILDVMQAARLWLPLLDQHDETLPAFVRLLADELDRHAVADDRRSLARLLEEL